MSCARVKTYTTAKIGASERHNERKNNDYGNVNVDPERICMNVHYKDPHEKSYMDILREKETSGELSRRGLKQDAVIFDEVVFDVNTMYFEERGGYEYAKQFYEEAYRFACEKYGESNIISAVMHADEINKAASDYMGYSVYHYHLHVMAFPVVEKEILWSKRYKDPNLVGKVKDVIHQISHSKKWESKELMLDNEGNQILRKSGKPKYRASYSILQDEFYNHMNERGYTDFERGREGSSTEHLSSLQYQIEKDKERLNDIKTRIAESEIEYNDVQKTIEEIDEVGKKTISGKYTVFKEDYEQLTSLAKEGITSRGRIKRLESDVEYYKTRFSNLRKAYENLEQQLNQLKEKCRIFIAAMEHFPNFVRVFNERMNARINEKLAAERESQEKTERRYWAKQCPHNPKWDKEYGERDDSR